MSFDNHQLPKTRRDLLKRSALGLGALGLIGLLQDDQQLSGADAGHGSPTSLQVKPPHFPGRAKRVIHFFLNGGPSHVDTFDPKPALLKYAGKPLPQTLRTERKTGAAFPSPFEFKRYGESGIEVSELFSRTAAHIDDIAVIRSMHAQVPNHEPSLMLMNCGDSVQSRPSLGSWLMYGLGTENQNLPGFVAMCPGGLPIKDNENWQSAFLPGTFQGTYIDSKHTEFKRLIENIEHPQIKTEHQRNQLDLLEKWNKDHQQTRLDQRLESRISSYELAFRMQQDAKDAFDITDEPTYIQEMYGDGVHGRQTLIARRLVERGVRYVQLWHGAGQPWDNHDKIEDNHRRLANEIDQPIAALLTDLKQRGMLDETLILWGGEFGRTPSVELEGGGKSKLGRDHNHYGFTVWMAGGGIKGGTVHGATDEFGFRAVEDRTSVHDLHATMLHTLGLDHEKLTYRYGGRDFRLTDVHGRVLTEILA
ncbi:MAG: sulfatase [Rhodopirellula sp.]|nr:sulfatase [Rhodopirellula sp.]